MKLSIAQLKSIVATYVDEQKISVDTFVETRNNTIGLLDTVGKILHIESYFVDKLEMLNGEDLSFGKTVEEWANDLILPDSYDSTGANALAPYDSTYRPVAFSYTLGRKVIPQTIRNNDIERAVHNEGQLAEIVANKTKALYDSETMLRYQIKREALGVLAQACIDAEDSSNADATYAALSTTISAAASINEVLYCTATTTCYVVVKSISANDMTMQQALDNGFIIPYALVNSLAQPVDASTGEAFIEQVKKDVEIASDFSEGHSLNGNTLGATPEEGLLLVVLQGVMPSLEVKTQAGAFHLDKVAIPTKIVAIPDFGNADADIYAVLLDARMVKLHNTYRAVRENVNGKGDFLNLFFHTENTVHISRNCFVKVFVKP